MLTRARTAASEHHSLDEPAILLGGAFMSDVVENAEEDEKKLHGENTTLH
jgi:hypothetical protein